MKLVLVVLTVVLFRLSSAVFLTFHFIRIFSYLSIRFSIFTQSQAGRTAPGTRAFSSVVPLTKQLASRTTFTTRHFWMWRVACLALWTFQSNQTDAISPWRNARNIRQWSSRTSAEDWRTKIHFTTELCQASSHPSSARWQSKNTLQPNPHLTWQFSPSCPSVAIFGWQIFEWVQAKAGTKSSSFAHWWRSRSRGPKVEREIESNCLQ